VTVGTSTITDAGDGLFAAVDIPAETRIGTYSGIKTFGKGHYHIESDYAISSACGTFTVDAHDLDSGPFRMANDSLVEDLDNIQFRKNGYEFEVWTIKDVQTDEELFVSYNKHYWWYRLDRHPSLRQAITARHGQKPKNLNCIPAIARSAGNTQGKKPAVTTRQLDIRSFRVHVPPPAPTPDRPLCSPDELPHENQGVQKETTR